MTTKQFLTTVCREHHHSALKSPNAVTMETVVRRIPQQLFCRRWARLVSKRTPHTFSSWSAKRSQELQDGGPRDFLSVPHVRKLSSRPEGFICQELEERTLIRAAGGDAASFLQGLLTNNMDCLKPEKVTCGSTLYTFMLNVQGRVLYDLIVYGISRKQGQNDEFYIETNADVADEFLTVMKRYKIRKKVDLKDIRDEYAVWAVLPSSRDIGHSGHPAMSVMDNSKVVMCETDPRLKTFGYRAVLPCGVDASTMLGDTVKTSDDQFYTRRRYQEGLAEGSTELPPGNCFPLESNAVFLNGVSFSKGCYIGQELTARTYHTGVTRKRIIPITLDKEVQVDTVTSVENGIGKNCGKLRGAVEHHGLALLRISDAIGKGPLYLKDSEGVTLETGMAHVPTWWPVETDEIIKQAVSKLHAEKSQA